MSSYEVIAGVKARYARRRSIQETLIDILKVAMQPTIPTHLMYKSNLNLQTTREYANVLITKGLLKEGMLDVGEKVSGFNSKTKKQTFYQITKDGLEVLALVHQLEKLLGT